MERPGEAAGELFHLALLLPQGDEQRRAGFLGVFAAEPLGGPFLAVDFGAGRGRCHVDRDRVVEEGEPREIGDDAGPGALRPARERQHRMVVAVEIKSPIRLPDAFALPAVLLDGQGWIEQDRRVALLPRGEARIEELLEAREVPQVVHRPHGGFGAEDRAQRGRELLELPGQLAEQRVVVAFEAVARAQVARVVGDLNGEEQGKPFAAQLAREHLLPVAGEPLVARGADDGLGNCLGMLVVTQQLGPVVGVARPLELQPPARRHKGEQPAHLVLEGVQPLEACAAQVGRLQPESPGDHAAALRRAKDEEVVDEPAVRGIRMGFRMGDRITLAREVAAAKNVFDLVTVIARGLAVFEQNHPPEGRRKRGGGDPAGQPKAHVECEV